VGRYPLANGFCVPHNGCTGDALGVMLYKRAGAGGCTTVEDVRKLGTEWIPAGIGMAAAEAAPLPPVMVEDRPAVKGEIFSPEAVAPRRHRGGKRRGGLWALQSLLTSGSHEHQAAQGCGRARGSRSAEPLAACGARRG
jgi:hypothetical protein